MKSPAKHANNHFYQGFTLVEVAVVLVIIGLVMGTFLVTLGAQIEQRKLSETRVSLENAKEALLGYAMAHGRFPCPAQAPSAGITAVEAFGASGTATNGVCNDFFVGYLPSVTLGLSPTDTDGYMLDGWNNPIRYAISNLSDDTNTTYVFTKTFGMKNANSATCAPNCGMTWIANQPLISICSTGTGIIGGGCSGLGTTLAQGAVLVIYSTGPNTSTGGVSTDEAANLNADSAFVSHEPYAAGANEFDDIVEWASASSIFGRLVQAHQLP